jgi:hypothetical protein
MESPGWGEQCPRRVAVTGDALLNRVQAEQLGRVLRLG